jgi:Outer membrane lipoprotein carrier protein LolA-like
VPAAIVSMLVFVALAAVPAISIANPEAAPANLGALLSGFRTMSGFEARFEEEKHLALLAAPLRSRGRLYFSPPSTLLRRVEAPNPHDILIHDQVVRIATPRGGAAPGKAPGSAANPRDVETIDLEGRDDVRPLVESMLWIFSGDLASLEKTYRIDYQVLAPPGNGDWTLHLAPREASLSRLIRELVISGRGRAAEQLEVTEAGGDRTTTRILDANHERLFKSGEIEAIFGVTAP